MTSNYFLFIAMVLLLFSCDKTRVFEQNIDIKQESWNMLDTLQFSTQISDRNEKNLYINLRHNTDFNWRNIWLSLSVELPNDSSYTKALNLSLSQPNGQWYGKCASDICEIQFPIEAYTAYSFSDTGTYLFKLSHEMRENPLLHILSAGIRIENTIEEN